MPVPVDLLYATESGTVTVRLAVTVTVTVTVRPRPAIKDVVSLDWSGEAIEMENLFIILRLVRQYKLGRKGRSRRPGPARARL